ncbi:protein fucoxanthin chlorophyll a/c protein [Phaeodactylum tricornutum CCAP 1055/1]|jgi:hypothetical protein|uniref:Protein fucoxanthin chlorophyll a/c protein n=3 Tax=Phaeodactylum tricornutum TaxID=2850 RepID=B7FUM6_PHATC|nr:protein fucoxanthin chlorophyll a/c protein [Phaeodactylum tricornutum CCAP 1055/1]EEC50289.1 protein fucoxanthin chlorophyll a/c protein [Phaeodactylum tricornutum CCAP 1055/1]|mmetsp:Transcript_9099/g.21785  ORF Transcript_9099/g.21785 Transcript_9099/m.21785 type:complete len:201 (-) Transcript_9099:117-719(-)|eukprot:XP_002178624.1 protein fucoxanthin chlorophyll a/c protein [Phaeodactylum tricornutum CCAP 1055/1]
MKYAVFASLLASAAAFAPAAKPAASTSALNAEMSKSMPFLTAPKNTGGYVGDVGFDPLGFSDNFDMKWLRESEIKHGRAAMLATVGFVMQQFWTLPGMVHVDDSNLAPGAAGISPMLQIVFGMGALEWWTNKGKVTMEDMFSDSSREPGNLGFDPMGMSKNKSKEEAEAMQLKEIKNGRLAMLAIGGMIHHNWVTGEALF